MDLEQFAKACGVIIERCDTGSPQVCFEYIEKDNPHTFNGPFKTRRAAIKDWMINNFGEIPSKVILKMLEGKK